VDEAFYGAMRSGEVVWKFLHFGHALGFKGFRRAGQQESEFGYKTPAAAVLRENRSVPDVNAINEYRERLPTGVSFGSQSAVRPCLPFE
jgi:hypothetical protein